MFPRHYILPSLFMVGPACLAVLAGRSAIDAVLFGFLCVLPTWVLSDLSDQREARGKAPGVPMMIAVIGSLAIGLALSWANAAGVL